MNCIHCRGQMELTTAPFHIDRSGFHITIDAVSAWICGQCGEPYFEEQVVDAIQGVVRSLDQQTRQLAADFSQPGSHRR